ncbi:AMP-binding protein [Flavobacterium sp. xlx-214]|uniref:phenylacetate--CoA ligase family protein n=1 Tax=unclassified Flavobacterium TaxID=196869 RepID=UPI0013D85178|nr:MULTISPECIES: AMP-binding protein [unclassified Flavobacterium]MBA5792089.1 AMP-binding protein [Flavobacterium sp. xlx-221]QMI84336.1 AMP-binding protein [Flavobacterium sp. xlx-214]
MIPEIETKSLAEIEALQNTLLQKQIAYLMQHSPFYQRKFRAENIDVKSIQTIADLQKISVTTKADIQLYNNDFFCVDKSQILDYATTSGTLGDPVTFGLTDNDLERLAYNEMLSFQCAGVQKGDLVQLMTTMDRRFMAGLAYFLGLRKLGAGIVRVGAGVPTLQWDSILRYQPKYLIAVPSFLLKMIDYAQENNIDYKNCSVKGVICIGEALRTTNLEPTLLAQRIQEKWNIELFSTYASTEMSAAFTECALFQGGHHHPELIITEIVDENNQPVADGELGELVVTTLSVEAMPLLRFKTGDMLRKHTQKCNCGRNTYRLGPVEGRKQQMIKYKGTTLYPPAMHDAVAHFNEIKLHLIEISSNDIGTDEILIRIFSEDTSEEFSNKLKDYFRARLRVTPQIVFEEELTLQKIIFDPLSRKPITFIDKR